MAVGLGYMFGLRIPQNFNSPYKALDPADFWRRWHISLSTCMRDYLYIPFGGNRGSTAETYRNLMLTMLIGGLWHGAAWTFVFWGGYHGDAAAIYRANAGQWDRLPRAFRQLAMFLVGGDRLGVLPLDELRDGAAACCGRCSCRLPGVPSRHACRSSCWRIAIAALWSMRGPERLRDEARLALARAACPRLGIRRGAWR